MLTSKSGSEEDVFTLDHNHFLYVFYPTPLQEVAKSDYKHYVLLFRNTGLQFRGLYGYSPDSDEICKIYGTGPRHITPKMIEGLYK